MELPQRILYLPLQIIEAMTETKQLGIRLLKLLVENLGLQVVLVEVAQVHIIYNALVALKDTRVGGAVEWIQETALHLMQT